MVDITKIDVGDRVEVTHLVENDPSISVGSKGTVKEIIEDALGTKVWVEFDNGSCLGMLPEDEVKVLE